MAIQVLSLKLAGVLFTPLVSRLRFWSRWLDGWVGKPERIARIDWRGLGLGPYSELPLAAGGGRWTVELRRFAASLPFLGGAREDIGENLGSAQKERCGHMWVEM